MRTTFLVATALAAALPNIASAQNTRQVSIPFHLTGGILLMEADVYVDGDKVVINPSEPVGSDLAKRAVTFVYAFGELTDANLGKLDIIGPRYTSAVPGQDYRKREGITIFKDASGDALIVRFVGKGVATSTPNIRVTTDSGSFMGGTGKFEAASGPFESKTTADIKANTATVDYTGTINLVCGGKRQAAACTR